MSKEILILVYGTDDFGEASKLRSGNFIDEVLEGVLVIDHGFSGGFGFEFGFDCGDCDGGGMKVVKDQKRTLWEKDWRSVQAAVSTACVAEK